MNLATIGLLPDDVLAVLPILICFGAALACALVHMLGGGSAIPGQRVISIVGMALLTLVASALVWATDQDRILVSEVSGWAPPWGIAIVIDRFGAAMVLISAIIGLCAAIYMCAFAPDRAERAGSHVFSNFMLFGVCGAFVTGDLFNLFVWFEILLISSFVLLAMLGTRAALGGAFRYVVLNLIGSAIFLMGAGLLYNATGTLNMADVGAQIAHGGFTPLIMVVAAMLTIAFAAKAALFPLYFWLPDSYHTPPPVVSAVFAGLLTKVGVYALMRVWLLLFNGPAFASWLVVLLWIAGLTMTLGVIGAAVQGNIRRILGFHIISQVGYMIMGLAIATPLAIAGAVFYIIHHIIVKSALFLIAGVIEARKGTGELARIGGFAKTSPLWAILFAVPALSLAGIPPLSGFWAKFILVRASIDTANWWILAVALAVSLATIFSMAKIWNEAFWKNQPANVSKADPAHSNSATAMPRPVFAVAACAIAAGLTLILSFSPERMMQFASRTAQQLVDPAQYIEAVLAARAARGTNKPGPESPAGGGAP